MKVRTALIFKGILCTVDSAPPTRYSSIAIPISSHQGQLLGVCKRATNTSEQVPLVWLSHENERGITARQQRS